MLRETTKFPSCLLGNPQSRDVILDNAPVHPAAASLQRGGGRFTAQYLPPNVTSLLQPIDQTVIASLKRNYPRLILRTLIQQDDETPTSRKEFLKGYDLKDAFHNIRSSWRCCEKHHTESCLE